MATNTGLTNSIMLTAMEDNNSNGVKNKTKFKKVVDKLE